MTRLILLLALLPLAIQAEEAVSIKAKRAADLLFFPDRSAPAEVVPLNDASLSAEINARIDQIAVRVGDQVKAGDLLARLDCRDYRSSLEAQKATRKALESRIALARAQLKRARNLKKARNISDEEVDRRETELQAQRAELAAQKERETQARNNVARCDIKAPFNAVVSERLASVGALASPGTPLLHLVQIDDSEVSARVRPEEAAEGAAAESVRFSYLGRDYPLKLLRLLPVVEPRTRTLEVRFGFSEQAAPPGASGRIHWRSAAAHLPADLPIRRDGGLGIFLLNDGQAHFHPLPKAREGRPAAVDLPADARVITEGRQGLQDGDPVTPGE